MTIHNEALISRYFDRQMTSGEEQNFLISLAASDELRLAFRSHLELMKAIRDDKHEMQPIAEVRGRTLAALGLSAAVTAPFLEQALLHSNVAKAATPKPTIANDVNLQIPIQSSRSLLRGIAGKFLLTSSGLVIGFLAASLFFSSPQVSPIRMTSSPKASVQPQIQSQPATTEVIKNAVPKSVRKSAIHLTPAIATQTQHSISAVKPVGEVNESTPKIRESNPSGTVEIRTSLGDSTSEK